MAHKRKIIENNCQDCERPDYAENMVCCDNCGKWLHFSCAGVNSNIRKRDFICNRCKGNEIH